MGMTHVKIGWWLAIVAGCGSVAPALDGGEGAPDGGIVAGDGDILGDGEGQEAAGCPADPARCLYRPPVLPIELLEVTATDPSRIGGPRTLNVAIRYSRAAPTPMPVVIWSHGGADGETNAVGALDKWAIAAAEAGYFSVAIAHTPRDQASRAALCGSLGFDAAGCATFKYLSYDRPRDISLVIDNVVALGAQPQFAGKLDVARLAVGGHSAGAGGALMVAGAARDINGVSTVTVDPRPIAFLAMSPQAPGSDGMTAAGYGQVTRPTLIGTGRGDDDPPDTADGRASVFDLMQPGGKARIFIEAPAAIHTVFALETDACAASTPVARCEQMRDWVRSAGLAFLDGNVRGTHLAQAWLASNALGVASAGVAEWSTR